MQRQLGYSKASSTLLHRTCRSQIGSKISQSQTNHELTSPLHPPTHSPFLVRPLPFTAAYSSARPLANTMHHPIQDPETIRKAKEQDWWLTFDDVNPHARDILEKYSGIAPADVVQHVRDIVSERRMPDWVLSVLTNV